MMAASFLGGKKADSPRRAEPKTIRRVYAEVKDISLIRRRPALWSEVTRDHPQVADPT